MRLLECSQCQTQNTLDSKFCRSCGDALPEGERDTLRQENDKLVRDGRDLLAAGRTDESRMIADSVLEVQPDNHQAWALLADTQEKKNQLAEALESYRQAAVHDPHSAIYRIKIEHFERQLAEREAVIKQPRDRRLAVFAFVAATVLLASVGTALAISAKQASADSVARKEPEAQSTISGFNMVPPVPEDETKETTAQTNTGTQTDPNTAVNQPNGGQPTSNTGVGTGYSVPRPRNNGGGLTGVLGGGSNSEIPPFEITPDPNVLVNANTQTQPQPDPQPQPQPDRPPVDETPKERPGQVIIEVLDKGGSNGSDSTRADELVGKARDSFNQGDYASAARFYEEALQSGASAASTNQRLAQCYEKLGRRGDARNAYRRAVAAYDRMIASGNDLPRIRSSREACATSLKNLGG